MLVTLFALIAFALPAPQLESALLFPPQKEHAHGSCVVQCPNGDLLAVWYQGSGERQADDVRLLGSRLPNAQRHMPNAWSAPFPMADTPGLPDCNPCMVVDQRKRLWLIWPVILDNHWKSALLKYQVSDDYGRPGPPRWSEEGVILLKPGPEFAATMERDLEAAWAPAAKLATPELQERLKAFLASKKAMAADKLKTRLGWMPRVHPFLDGGRMIVPLYSDGFDFSLMAITDDGGKTWTTSAPLVGAGNVQPAIARREDGTYVAYMRDNGPPPKRALVSESRDHGATWTMPRDTVLPNPGSGLDVVVLASGAWLMVYNDTENGRHSLAVSLSDDEGRTWPVIRHIERDTPSADAGSYSYPSIIQARDGRIHVTYSFSQRRSLGGGQSIKWGAFDEAWIRAGDQPRTLDVGATTR